MNKRSLLLIFFFTIVMFFVHNYFLSDSSSATKHENNTEETTEKVFKKHTPQSISLSSLPVVMFFDSDSESDLIGYGLKFDESFLVYQNEETPLKDSLLAKNQNDQKTLIKKASSPKGFNVPFIYTKDGTLPRLTSFFMPEASKFPVQLVEFDNQNMPKVTPAFYENQHIHFEGNASMTRAVVLAKYQSKYIPVGFYNPSDSTFLALSQAPSFSDVTTFMSYKSDTPSVTGESFYVLENDYQQVVFSNFGGSVAEINLPFKSKTNIASVVLPIGFDKIIKERYPLNAFFPIQPYFVAGSTQLQDPKRGGFHPLIRRDLENGEGKTSFITPPRLYALNLVSNEEQDLAKKVYKVTKFEKDLIQFQLVQPHRRITKTFYFVKNNDKHIPYTLRTDIKVDGDSKGLYITSGVPEVELISGSASPDIKYRYNRNQKNVVEKLKLPKNSSSVVKGISPDWISNSNGFFGLILDPTSETIPGLEAEYISGTQDPTRLSLIDAKNDLYPPEKYPGYITRLPIKPSSKTSTFTLYAGPYDQTVLKAVDKALTNEKTGYSPMFSKAQSFHGWFSFISEPFAKFLMILLNFFYSFTKSWALCIVLITIVLRLLLYPLNSWSFKSMTKMQMLAPDVERIKKRYAKDPKRVQLETMQLYKEKGANPFSGCLPMIIQMPFLIGMFDLLKSAFQLRGASFIPGWIDNLAAPDVLFSWSYPIFFFGTEFHLLPFILGAMMLLQQKITTWTSKNKKIDPEAQKQTMISGNVMTIVFTLMFYNFPSGLNIYWISSTALGILQQYMTARKLNKASSVEIV